MIDFIVIGIIIAFLAFLGVRFVKNRREGKSVGCGSGCGGCSSSSLCHPEEMGSLHKNK